MPDEELITRSEYERLRWQGGVESWQQAAEARQSRLESSLGELTRRLGEALDQVPFCGT